MLVTRLFSAKKLVFELSLDLVVAKPESSRNGSSSLALTTHSAKRECKVSNDREDKDGGSAALVL